MRRFRGGEEEIKSRSKRNEVEIGSTCGIKGVKGKGMEMRRRWGEYEEDMRRIKEKKGRKELEK